MFVLKSVDLEGEGDVDGKMRKAVEDYAIGARDASEMILLKPHLEHLRSETMRIKELTCADLQVDRDAPDESVHRLDFLFDSAIRACSGAGPLEEADAQRIRAQISELAENVMNLDPISVPSVYKQLSQASTTLHDLHSSSEKLRFRKRSIAKVVPGQAMEPWSASPSGRIPWGLILAVSVDAAVDGLLIGLAASVALGSGLIMACATTIEMFFLGCSFCCKVLERRRPLYVTVSVCAIPPASLLICTVATGAASVSLKDSVAFSGLIAFSMVALLFLVFQELVVEAAEKDKEATWHVSICLYLGLVVSIILHMALA
ncbi:unnamed protein product [Polarella glacialis]|uniref:Uncharacterized protein n=1 Tax=Polarella glacialis TaxID=89957 RepID=A0A813EJR9_POLGL|nr:unnamed protein product [Polarella glacialis]CAE8657449.1 unnamed protein product [Polarella glacialis]